VERDRAGFAGGAVGGSADAQIGNSKFEARNPKQIPNGQTRENFKTSDCIRLRHFSF
jgi:hypothetical protein